MPFITPPETTFGTGAGNGDFVCELIAPIPLPDPEPLPDPTPFPDPLDLDFRDLSLRPPPPAPPIKLPFESGRIVVVTEELDISIIGASADTDTTAEVVLTVAGSVESDCVLTLPEPLP